MLRIAVCGSGPGGMYFTKYLLKHKSLVNKIKIDVIDKLPVPYGLVRFGVAPDHQEVKSVSNDFDIVMEDPAVSFCGNVCVGKDISVKSLLDNYDGVVLSYGCNSDRLLQLENENAGNVWGAHDFVKWYNGDPLMKDIAPPLLDQEEAVVVGQGNVALDIARILSKDIDELAKTDISSTALEMLSQSKVRKISLLGRRGSAQAAFTIKEMRELTKMQNVVCRINPLEYKSGMTEVSLKEIKENRAKKRINDLLKKVVDGYDDATKEYETNKQSKLIDLRFLVSPIKLNSDKVTKRVCSVDIGQNQLVGTEVDSQTAVLKEEQSFETLSCGLLVRSIGFKSEPLPGVPFNSKKNIISNEGGRVKDIPGLYTSGWVKRGPTGIVGTNINDARETVENAAKDLAQIVTPKSHIELKDLVSVPVVDWNSYKKIENKEIQRGNNIKPREKILNIEEMLKIAQGNI